MFQRVVEIITRYSMFRSGIRAGVAVSGGADSVCLLHVLRELAPRWDLQLAILHLNHGLRGEESDRDEEFVRGMAAQLGLPVIVERWDRSAGITGNLENAAREARLDFFARAISSGAVEKVAVGHTRSDQAETVLFRFLRGAATAGLAGIRPVTSTGIVRPLLGVGRPEVEAFLRERGISWREDSTNATTIFARNRIRHELLPRLAAEWNPAIGDTLANTADWALAEESYWDAEIDRLEADCLVFSDNEREGPVVLARVDTLRALPLAAARRMVRRAMERVKGDLLGIDFRHISGVVELAASTEGHGRLQAPGLDIFRSFSWLRFAKPGVETLENRNYRVAAPAPGTIGIPCSSRVLQLEVIDRQEALAAGGRVYNSEVGDIDWSSVSGLLELRNWRPGDQYQPIGSSGEQKIKTLFQEARIPLWERRHWPVLTDGTGIVWARQFGPAAKHATGPETRFVLKVTEA